MYCCLQYKLASGALQSLQFLGGPLFLFRITREDTLETIHKLLTGWPTTTMITFILHFVCRYRLLVFDHGLLSFVDVALNSWPVVVITNPKNALFLIDSHEPTKSIRYSTHIR